MNSPIQKIIFGSPGTGKSHKVDEIINEDLAIYIKETPENIIKTVFHPEYTYGDFIGKLVPISRNGKPEYNYYEGHFLKALAQAYKNLIEGYDRVGNRIYDVPFDDDVPFDGIPITNVILVIDEINRGNSAAIFGSAFQLLDRNDDGWSSYSISINAIELIKILELIGISNFTYDGSGNIVTYGLTPYQSIQELLKKLNFDSVNRTIKIPPNLSIIATMNTSDSSIYYMDSAFKRRWDWEFMDVDGNLVRAEGDAFKNREEWKNFTQKLNTFIKSNHRYIRGIEDKQVGYWFINTNDDEPIAKSTIQNKLMFFIWDNVFSRDKKPLIELMKSSNDKLITFGDFAEQVDMFIKNIQEKY